jgi:hypothetical protein
LADVLARWLAVEHLLVLLRAEHGWLLSTILRLQQV